MSAILKLAEALKLKKGIGAAPARQEPPGPAPEAPDHEAPAPPDAKPIPKRANGRPRYSHSQHLLLQLEAQVSVANSHAERAEAAMIGLQAKIAEMGQRIETLGSLLHEARKRAAKAEAALVRDNQPMQRLTAAWKKNEELELQLREARKRADKAEAALVREDRTLDQLRVSARVNLQLSGRYSAACRNLADALNRIEQLEADNEQLRNQLKGDS